MCAGGRADFRHDIANMGFDRSFADNERSGNLLIGFTLRDQRRDRTLTLG